MNQNLPDSDNDNGISESDNRNVSMDLDKKQIRTPADEWEEYLSEMALPGITLYVYVPAHEFARELDLNASDMAATSLNVLLTSKASLMAFQKNEESTAKQPAEKSSKTV